VGQQTSPDPRCPRCNAHVRQDAEWCTLCYADLRPAPEPVPEPEPVVPAAEQPDADLDGPPARATALLVPAGADPMLGWLSRAAAGTAPASASSRPAGRHSRRRATEPPASLDGVDVDAMLAVLAAESDSGLGPLASRLESKGSKAIVIAGGIGAVCLVLFVVMAVLGALL
jgi:hypothetical protein